MNDQEPLLPLAVEKRILSKAASGAKAGKPEVEKEETSNNQHSTSNIQREDRGLRRDDGPGVEKGETFNIQHSTPNIQPEDGGARRDRSQVEKEGTSNNQHPTSNIQGGPSVRPAGSAEREKAAGIKIVVSLAPGAAPSDICKSEDMGEPNGLLPSRPTAPEAVELQQIPARMMNEFVYCRRLFYYEFVEGVFVESADTVRGEALHQRVDAGSGAMPAAKGRKKNGGSKIDDGGGQRKSESPIEPASPVAAASGEEPGDKPDTIETIGNRKLEIENDVIHSRSVQMGSERLGIVAKMDLVEVRNPSCGEAPQAQPELPICGGAPQPRQQPRTQQADLFGAALEV
ncbi:MAG TPA: hypothetical protein VF988_00405, partial [Verrucomicrobiae bacterium]